MKDPSARSTGIYTITNGERLQALASSHDPALVKVLSSTSNNSVSHTFNQLGKKCTDYIFVIGSKTHARHRCKAATFVPPHI